VKIPAPTALTMALASVATLVLALAVATSVGSVSIPLRSIQAIVAHHLFRTPLDGVPASWEAIVWQVRLPRVLVALLVGMALSVGGALYQSLLRNPLAEPFLLGVSGGAGFAAVLVTATGLTALGSQVLPLGAFAGALAASGLIVALSRVGGRLPAANLILAGVALGSLLSALTAFVLIRGQGAFETSDLLGWLMGSLARASWPTLRLIAPYIVVPLAATLFLGRAMNVMLLGDAQAQHLGLAVERIKPLMLGLAGVLAAASVAGAGVVGFVGLIVPHAVRLTLGPDNRLLVPVAAVAGGVFLVACDTLGRVVFAPAEVPVGIVTALFGAPFFLWLLRHQRGATTA